MIFTDRFVYVHMAKTGGTFVTQALKTIYRDKPSQPPFSAPHFPFAQETRPESIVGTVAHQPMTATKTKPAQGRPANYKEYLRPRPVEIRWSDRYGEAIFWEGLKHGGCWQ